MKKSITLLSLLLCTISLHSQIDTVPPVLECAGFTTITAPAFSFCQLDVFVTDLIDTFYDNESGAGQIELGIRRLCTGTGFPEGLYTVPVYTYEIALVEIWARDQAGNTSTCTTHVRVNFVGIACDPAFYMQATMPETGLGIDDVNFHVYATNCLGEINNRDYSSLNTGVVYGLGYAYPSGYNAEVTGMKNVHPLNGVTTYDLLLISRHILGIEPFDSPYKIIAADANQDGQVTIFDIVVLRKLILGISEELPNGKSWVFVPQDYVFPDPENPFLPPFAVAITTPPTTYRSDFKFIGVKIGDVDFSADPHQ